MSKDAGERDVFKDHVATYEQHNDYLETLKWKNPKSSTYAVWYVRQNGFLMVFGDLYEATYRWNWQPGFDLRWIAGCDPCYFLGKCCASPHGRKPYIWDIGTAEFNMEEYFHEFDDKKYNEGYEEEREQREKERRYFEEYAGRHALESKFEWNVWCYEHAHEAFGQDWYENITLAEPGRIVDPCIKLHLEGLKAAMAQLEERHEGPYRPDQG